MKEELRWNLESARAELGNTEAKLSWALEISNIPSMEARLAYGVMPLLLFVAKGKMLP